MNTLTKIAIALLALIAQPVLGQVAPNAVAVSTSDEMLALARNIVAKGFPVDARHAMFASSMDSVMKQIRGAQGVEGADAGVLAIIDRHTSSMRDQALVVVDRHAPAIFDAVARAYARNFSIDELKVIDAFAGTQAGQHFISRGASLLADPDVSAANQAYIAEVLAMLPVEREKIAAETRDYLAKHPEVLEHMRKKPKT